MNSYLDESSGSRLRTAIEEERPLQMVGTINAFCSLLAEAAGFKAVYLSGAGVANASFGLPDLGMTTVNEVAEDVRRITATTNLPLMVDADTGWGSAFNIARAVRELSRAGAAGRHIEDRLASGSARLLSGHIPIDTYREESAHWNEIGPKRRPHRWFSRAAEYLRKRIH